VVQTNLDVGATSALSASSFGVSEDSRGGDEGEEVFDFVVIVVGVGVALALILAFGTVLATNRKLRRKVGLCFSCGRCGCGVEPVSYPAVESKSFKSPPQSELIGAAIVRWPEGGVVVQERLRGGRTPRTQASRTRGKGASGRTYSLYNTPPPARFRSRSRSPLRERSPLRPRSWSSFGGKKSWGSLDDEDDEILEDDTREAASKYQHGQYRPHIHPWQDVVSFYHEQEYEQEYEDQETAGVAGSPARPSGHQVPDTAEVEVYHTELLVHADDAVTDPAHLAEYYELDAARRGEVFEHDTHDGIGHEGGGAMEGDVNVHADDQDALDQHADQHAPIVSLSDLSRISRASFETASSNLPALGRKGLPAQLEANFEEEQHAAVFAQVQAVFGACAAAAVGDAAMCEMGGMPQEMLLPQEEHLRGAPPPQQRGREGGALLGSPGANNTTAQGRLTAGSGTYLSEGNLGYNASEEIVRLASLEMGSMGDDGDGVQAEAAGLALNMLANASQELQRGEIGGSFVPAPQPLRGPDGAGERSRRSTKDERSRRSTKDSQGTGRSLKGRNDSHGDHQPTPPNMAPPPPAGPPPAEGSFPVAPTMTKYPDTNGVLRRPRAFKPDPPPGRPPSSAVASHSSTPTRSRRASANDETSPESPQCFDTPPETMQELGGSTTATSADATMGSKMMEESPLAGCGMLNRARTQAARSAPHGGSATRGRGAGGAGEVTAGVGIASSSDEDDDLELSPDYHDGAGSEARPEHWADYTRESPALRGLSSGQRTPTSGQRTPYNAHANPGAIHRARLSRQNSAANSTDHTPRSSRGPSRSNSPGGDPQPQRTLGHHTPMPIAEEPDDEDAFFDGESRGASSAHGGSSNRSGGKRRSTAERAIAPSNVAARQRATCRVEQSNLSLSLPTVPTTPDGSGRRVVTRQSFERTLTPGRVAGDPFDIATNPRASAFNWMAEQLLNDTESMWSQGTSMTKHGVRGEMRDSLRAQEQAAAAANADGELQSWRRAGFDHVPDESDDGQTISDFEV